MREISADAMLTLSPTGCDVTVAHPARPEARNAAISDRMFRLIDLLPLAQMSFRGLISKTGAAQLLVTVEASAVTVLIHSATSEMRV